MTIKQLHYFIAVAETKSFTHAARNYFIAQTAMSQQISALEKELGFLLFHRTNRVVELTKAGTILYEKVRPLVLELENALEDASTAAGVRDQYFRIGIYDGAINRFLAPALKEFSRQEPDSKPLLISDNYLRLLDSMANRKIDAMLLGQQYYKPRAMLTATELFSYKVLQYVLAVPAESPLAQQERIQWQDLQSQPLIAYSPFREDQQGLSLAATLKQHQVTAPLVLSTRSIASALLYVEAGMGCCLLPPRAAERENLQVKIIPMEEEHQDTMLLITHKDSESSLISRFSAICRRTMKGAE